MSRKNCVYCNKEITTRSSEHVIHNALGGLYESTDICCPECNNYISKCIDNPFTSTFNPIIGRIDSLNKSRQSNPPMYTGTVSYNGKEYPANFKGRNVCSCAELSKELRCDATKLPLQATSFDFKIDNVAFQNGIAKIAFNYALDRGIDLDLLRNGLDIEVTPSGEHGINFKYPIIPFCPMNQIDEYLELQSDITLYHNMKLFNNANELWCYIDLFNTFQYYVLLSDEFPSTIQYNDMYTQTLQKINRDMPKLYISGPKDILIYAQQYGVEPCMNIDEFARRIQNAINKKSQKISVNDIISKKITAMSVPAMALLAPTREQRNLLYRSHQLYFNSDDAFNTDAFRTLTTYPNSNDIWSYPHAINNAINENKVNIAQYTTAKFNRLNSYLSDKTR